MQFLVARGAMNFIAKQGKLGYLETIGMTEEDFDKVSGVTPWLATDRNRMVQCLNTLLTATLDVLGIPRHELCAEYVAAGISIFVHPINVHTACRFMENLSSASAMGRGVDDTERISSSQLFALVVQLVADPDYSVARLLFERNTGLKIEKTEKELLQRVIDKERVGVNTIENGKRRV